MKRECRVIWEDMEAVVVVVAAEAVHEAEVVHAEAEVLRQEAVADHFKAVITDPIMTEGDVITVITQQTEILVQVPVLT